MQQAQRTEYNHALAFALERARELSLPLVVGFVLTPGYPEANRRHYHFMLQGIADVQECLEQANIPFVLQTGEMVPAVLRLAAGAAWVVTDVGYLHFQRKWREEAAGALGCPFTAVETDVIVPVAVASDKAEAAARTFRPRVLKRKDVYLDAVPAPRGLGSPAVLPEGRAGPVDPEGLLLELPLHPSVESVPAFTGGQRAAKMRLQQFIGESLADYEKLARDPAAACQSDMSPYLHFGQISPVFVYREVSASDAPDAAKWSYLEQLLVRRELSINFVYYEPGCGAYEAAVPRWARESLEKHRIDARPYLYSREQLEAAETHDPYWNAAQTEMMASGKMHNYMRMYWGKKMIEWSTDPAEAFRLMLELNNRYELDGRDPNSYAGVAWCFGRHDRPWQERPVFGKVRYMNARGLERKFRINDYAARVRRLV
jgi:deoxyribodipyrimidine photo-lyase